MTLNKKAGTTRETKDFTKPYEIDVLTTVFPAKVSHLMPTYKDIPEEFRNMNNHQGFLKFADKWFFHGLKPEEFPAVKKGIDRHIAIRHLAAIQRSIEPKHEHKRAAVAYLASLWFEVPKL